jgi:HEAT repeat protein
VPPSSPADQSWEFLDALHRLSALLADAGAADGARGVALRALAELARVRRLDVRVRTLAEHAPDGAPPGAVALIAGLHRAGVRRLVVRCGATERELAQFAGLLARARADAPEDAAADPAATLAAIAAGLDDLGIWNVQVGTLEAPERARVEACVPELWGAIAAAAAVRTPAGLPPAYAAVHGALGRVAGQFGAPVNDAAAVAAALAALAQHVARVAEHADPATRRAHQAELAALIEPWADTVARASVEGALADAAPVLRLVADRAVPALLESLGAAQSLDERRRCFGAVLDASGGLTPLLAALRDPRWYVVRNVALALGELRDPAAVRPLARCLAAGGDDRARAAVADALERIGTPAAAHALLPALRDPSPLVRLAAARAATRAAARAGSQHAPVRGDLLAARLRVETDVAVAGELLDALAVLAALGDPEAAAVVARLAAGRESPALGDRLARAALARLLAQPAAPVVAMLRSLAVGGDTAGRMAARVVLARLAQARRAADGGDAPPGPDAAPEAAADGAREGAAA